MGRELINYVNDIIAGFSYPLMWSFSRAQIWAYSLPPFVPNDCEHSYVTAYHPRNRTSLTRTRSDSARQHWNACKLTA